MAPPPRQLRAHHDGNDDGENAGPRGPRLAARGVRVAGIHAAAGAARKSALMFAIDDLRTQLYPEGGEVMHTPNFERIAKQSVVFDSNFERAEITVALCMPSRTSLLTGRRPDTSWTIEPDQWFPGLHMFGSESSF